MWSEGDIYPLGEETRARALQLVQTLRAEGLAVQMEFSTRKLKKIMAYASDARFEHVLVLGEEELREGAARLKRMSDGAEEQVTLDQLAQALQNTLSIH